MKTWIAGLLTLLLMAGPVFAQKNTTVAVVHPLDGIHIGTTLAEAQSMLARIGTGGGRDTRDGGRKEAWSLKETDFATLAFKTDGKGKIVWVSAFVRPGEELAFEKLGDLTKTTTLTKSQAIWNVGGERDRYRLVAKGSEGKANVVYLLSLEFPEVE